MSDSLLARKYVDGIYIPLGLLVVGTAIVKREWTAYALLLGIVLGGIKFYNNRTFLFPHDATSRHSDS
jgi:cytochrome-b5 reductase